MSTKQDVISAAKRLALAYGTTITEDYTSGKIGQWYIEGSYSMYKIVELKVGGDEPLKWFGGFKKKTDFIRTADAMTEGIWAYRRKIGQAEDY